MSYPKILPVGYVFFIQQRRSSIQDNYCIPIFSQALPKERFTKNSKVGIGQGDMQNESKGQGRYVLKQQTCIITTDKDRWVSPVDAFVDAIVSSLSSLPHLSCSTPTKISNETMKDQRSYPSVH